MSSSPVFTHPAALRRFLQTQDVSILTREHMSRLLQQLRRPRTLQSHQDANSVPLEHVAAYLDAILLAHADRLMAVEQQSDGQLPPVTREAFFERFKPRSSAQVLCGYLFQRNDIVFNCKTCQSDETCVLCLKCFQNGNHEGHDVFFHRTSPGGVCDCGDSEAWAPEGFCVNHGQRDGDTAAVTNSEQAGSLPEEIVQVADALFEAIVDFCVEMAKSSMQVFDAEFVSAQGRQTLHELRLHMQERGYSVEDAQAMEKQFHVRICNDDVHSDEDLIRSLSQKHIPKAEDLVRAIDSNGSEIVARNLTLRDALTLMQALKSEGWHVCVVQDRFIHDEDVLLRVTQWVKAICSQSKQLHVLFCGKLFATSNGQSKEPIQVMFLSDPYFRKDIVLELYELYLKLQGDKDPKLQFSIVFLKVYNRMMLKYFCGVGTREESLFQYGVQILTTPSIVHHLASLGLLDMLLDTINTALEMARALTLPPHQHQGVHHTLDCEHPLLKFKRYHFVIENFGYVLGIPAMSSSLLLRPDLLEKWLDALAEIQGLDPQARIQDGRAHVTYETQSWLTAFAFHANVSKILTFISKGLRYHEVGDTESRNRDRERMIFHMLEGFWEQLDRAGIATTRLQLYTPPCGRLMGSPTSERIVKYDVSTQPVSFHYPLHGLLASFLIESLYFGPPPVPGSAVPWVTNWGSLLEKSMAKVLQLNGVEGEHQNEFVRHKKEMLIYGMMEYPLRSLVLCAQISCGLWIRNGQNMQRQMLNYTSPPWCSELRDLDLFLVQVSATVVGFPKFLTIFFDRFGLSEWLLAWANVRNAGDESSGISAREAFSSGAEDEKLVGVLEAALLQLIWIVTELTPPLDAIEQRDTVLRREIIHRLSQHPCRLSELLDQTTFVVSTPFGGISARQEKQHLTRLERILEEVADEQVKRSVMVAPLGNGAGDDSMGDGAMEPTKYILRKEYYKEYDPSFYHLSRSSHEKAQFARQEALFKTWKVEDPPIPLVTQVPPPHLSLGTVRFLVLEKGLLNILRLVLEDANCPADGLCEGTSCTPGVKRTNVMVILRAIHVINLVVLVLKRGAGGNALPQENEVALPESKRRQTLALLRSGPEFFEEKDTASRGKKRVKRQQMSNEDGDVLMSSDSDQSELGEVMDLSIVALLVALSKDMVKHDFETSKSTISAVYWILRELSALDRVIHAYVDLKVWSGIKKHEELVAENGMSKVQLKKLHQQRAIEAMMARQKAFAQSSAFAEMDDEAEDGEDSGESGSASKFGMDSSDDPNHELPGHTIVYHPPPPPDCIICTQKEKDEPIMYIGHAQMSRVNAHARETLPGDVETALADAENSSDGNSGPSSSATGTPVFPPQIHLSMCGHAVHLHCWQKYYESVKAQSRFNLEHSQTNIAFDAHFGEFLCPLCQALSSMLVPFLPICSPLTLADQQRDRDAMERVFQAKQDTSSILSWLSNGLPSRLEALWSEGESMSDDEEEMDDRTRLQRQDEIRAMNQFAVSFLEAMLRFQPEMTHLASAMAALKKGFYSTGPQLTHLIWSSVASTITSTQLSGISSAIFSLEAYTSSSRNGQRGGNWRTSFAPRANGGAGPATAASSLSSLRITSILNPAVPCLKTRVAVSLPEALDPQLDQFTPKDDSKLNVLLRSLRRVPLLFTKRRQGFYSSICQSIAQNLRLNFSPEQWVQTLSQGPPLQLGQPILGQDLFYLCVAVCSSMLTTKADILLTIRSLCVLHMAQVLIQLAQTEAEDCLEEDNNETGLRRSSSSDDASPQQMEQMQRGLESLMGSLALEAGVDLEANVDEEGNLRRRPRGRQLQLLFKSSCLAFMRQVTLLCRAFFRGEQDPDASWSANFVSSLRLSTNYHDMCQQLGLPRITQLLADEALVDYLLRAARELRVRPTSAAVHEEVQLQYKQHGFSDQLADALRAIMVTEDKQGEDTATREALTARSNLREIPPLPLRQELDAQQHKNLFHFANIRLVKLASSYTDLHSEVLGKSKCKQTWKTVENPAICLVCEQVLCAGTECCRRRSDGMGACTHHAITCGAGVGLFFLMRSSSVLLVFGPRSSYFGSPYLDMFGEEDINVRRGRPLYLNAKRMKALQALYANHQLANEVARNRRTSDQYIRNNYY